MELIERLKTQFVVLLVNLRQQVAHEIDLLLEFLVLVFPLRSIFHFRSDPFEVSYDFGSHPLSIIKFLLHLGDLLLKGGVLASQEIDSAVDVFNGMRRKSNGLWVKFVELGLEVIHI